MIALARAFVGAWLILPFAGIEVGWLWYISYRVSLFTYQQQVIATSEGIMTGASGCVSATRELAFYSSANLCRASGSQWPI
ncbi:DUF2244 domain-containing protein [Paraglaciecola sp. Hal342]